MNLILSAVEDLGNTTGMVVLILGDQRRITGLMAQCSCLRDTAGLVVDDLGGRDEPFKVVDIGAKLTRHLR